MPNDYRFRATGYSWSAYFPLAVKWLLISNTAIFILCFLFPSRSVFQWFALSPEMVLKQFAVWQLVTYMFMHAGIGHLVINMLTLWMMGTELERMWGSRYFTRFYFISGVGAAVTTLLLSVLPLPFPVNLYTTLTVGASGAIYGVLLAYAQGYWAGSLPPCIRFFVSSERMAFKVRRRAELAFYEHGLHKTREGTGILIMASLLERRVQVLADKAINERVPPGTWDTLVNELVQGIKDGRSTEAFCRAIATCGDLLAQNFPAKPGDNPDELADDLIQEK